MVKSAALNIAKRYISQLPENMAVKQAYLFGSFAKKQNKIESDIDIAIVIENMKDFFEVQMQLLRLRRSIDLRIEPHPISMEDFTELNPFVNEIIHSGIKLL
jgi:predicted nucleotidyltransferase